jgi:hypothetical protein
MVFRTPAKISFALALAFALVALMPETANALGHPYGSWMEFDASAGYALPIQAVYQFPAAVAYQQGVELPIAPPVPLYIRVGDHHVLNR